MTVSAIASRYASALVDIATEPSSGLQPAQLIQQLRDFENAWNSSAELRNALSSPTVPPGRKKAVVGRLADLLSASKITRNFLFVLIDRRRMEYFPQIVEAFEVLLDEHLGIARGEVASAHELSEPQRSVLATELSRVTGKKMRLKFTVDETLIGGVVARIGSTLYDGSLKGQLEALGRRLGAD